MVEGGLSGLNWYSEPLEKVISQLETDAQQGLTESQAAERLANSGPITAWKNTRTFCSVS